MKTITLNEEAYQRLLEWKLTNKETFSQVVLSVVPIQGNANGLLGLMKQLPPLSDMDYEKLIEVYEDHRSPVTLRLTNNQ